MNPATLATITLIEGLVGVVAQGIAQLRAAFSGGPTADASLADADATYQSVINQANAILSQHPPTPPIAQAPKA